MPETINLGGETFTVLQSINRSLKRIADALEKQNAGDDVEICSPNLENNNKIKIDREKSQPLL